MKNDRFPRIFQVVLKLVTTAHMASSNAAAAVSHMKGKPEWVC